MMNIAQSLEQLIKKCRDMEYPGVSGLNPPASEAELSDFEAAIGQDMPLALAHLYMCHNGQDGSMRDGMGLFGLYGFCTLAAALELHSMHKETVLDEAPAPEDWIYGDYYSRKLIPFAAWDAYMLSVHSATGAVWIFHPSPGCRACASSIGDLLQALAQAPVRDTKHAPKATSVWPSWHRGAAQ